MSPPANVAVTQPAAVLKTERSKPSEAQTLRVTALCTPTLDSALAVDAAVRYLAHHFKADVLVLYTDDLAAAEQGVLPPAAPDAPSRSPPGMAWKLIRALLGLLSALWSLYARHHEISDEMMAMSAVEKNSESAQDELAREQEALERPSIYPFRAAQLCCAPGIEKRCVEIECMRRIVRGVQFGMLLATSEAAYVQLRRDVVNVDSVTRTIICADAVVAQPGNYPSLARGG